MISLARSLPRPARTILNERGGISFVITHKQKPAFVRIYTLNAYYSSGLKNFKPKAVLDCNGPRRLGCLAEAHTNHP